MKKILSLAVLLLTFIIPAGSVLKEKDLARTLGVLKAELQANYEMQQTLMQNYEQQGMQQHKQLVWYMHQCEQIGLMLYSQNIDNTFDMAYACQQAANLRRDLDNSNSKMRQYDKFIARMKQEIERTDYLIRSLKSMPPVIDADSILSSSDSILLQAIDSLAGKKDSLLIARKSMDEESITIMEDENNEIPEEEEEQTLEPLYLTRAQQRDRNACLLYADTIRSNMQHFLESLEAENAYYQSVRDKVRELDEYAQNRYKLLQDNIFRNGGPNYFSILASLPMQIMMAKSTIDMKYKPFEGHERLYSEWRGAIVLFISIFLIFYLALSLGISYIILRWLLPKKWRGPDFKVKRTMLNNVVGIALFAFIVMLVRTFEQRNFIQMGTGLIINIAWLLEAIFLSLYVRLKGEQMRHAAIIYTPLMLLSFIVILFRIVLIPNMLVNLIFPPILLVFAIWQFFVARRHSQYLPMLDKCYTHITNLALLFACLAAWIGYTLFAVQIMIWWTFQLAAIMTITCIYDLTKKYEARYLLNRLKKDNSDMSNLELLRRMQKGEYIVQTWFYDFFCRTVVPILAVLSVLVSIYWAAQVFEMRSLCQKIFTRDIVNQTGIIRISLYWVCMAAALYFIFRYINYALRSFYVHYRKQYSSDNEKVNKTLARNIIGIICWGLYIIIVLIIFRVPKDGISIVGAGLATGLGFAMQSILENFFYGISLMTGRIHVGDYIECDGIAGRVESITYQSTQILTNDGSVIAFLNSALFKKNFKNMTRNHRYELIKIPIGVAYGTNVEQVRQLLVDAIAPICQETNANGQPIADTNIPVSVAFANFGDSSIDLNVCVWMLVEEKFALTARIKEAVYNTLNKNNIEIPFPQRDVHIKTPQAPSGEA